MTYSTQGSYSATLPHGITVPRSHVCLNALVVLCHGWRSPEREVVTSRASAPGRWINPLLKWSRPVWRTGFEGIVGVRKHVCFDEPEPAVTRPIKLVAAPHKPRRAAPAERKAKRRVA